jgi:3-deoxy-manno-octulosonate cytidylyltransferase (CMP-KDO synthetase)
MKVVAVIPARLASTRLPRKMLREISGVPLLAWVYRGVQRCPSIDQVIIATDSDEIMRFCEQQGFVSRMTSATHRSGTERVHEISTAIPADVYLNVQGDEPLTSPEHIDSLIAVMQEAEVEVGTLKTPAAAVDVNSPSAVKVVTDTSGRALYFSRATIPHDRDGTRPAYYKHLGFYGYRKEALDRFVRWPESSLESSERLEQLRFLENGVSIFVGETPFDTVGVDTEEDVRRVEEILRTKHRQH